MCHAPSRQTYTKRAVRMSKVLINRAGLVPCTLTRPAWRTLRSPKPYHTRLCCSTCKEDVAQNLYKTQTPQRKDLLQENSRVYLTWLSTAGVCSCDQHAQTFTTQLPLWCAVHISTQIWTYCCHVGFAETARAAELADSAQPYVPSPIHIGWEVYVGAIAGVIPFIIGAYQFTARIVCKSFQQCQLRLFVAAQHKLLPLLRSLQAACIRMHSDIDCNINSCWALLVITTMHRSICIHATSHVASRTHLLTSSNQPHYQHDLQHAEVCMPTHCFVGSVCSLGTVH